MNVRTEIPVDAAFLKAEIKRNIFGEVECITSSPDGWRVYLRDADDLPACHLQTWAGLPVKYTVMPRAAA